MKSQLLAEMKNKDLDTEIVHFDKGVEIQLEMEMENRTEPTPLQQKVARIFGKFPLP